MTRAWSAIAALFMLGMGTPVVAADAGNHPSMSRHQMAAQVIACMKRRMSADQKISYNEAARSCKEQVDRQNEVSVSGPLVASDTPAK